MKVLLVSNYSPDQQHSMLGFAECLQRELRKFGVYTTTIAPTPRVVNISKASKVRKWLAYIDKYVVFPRSLGQQARQHDVTHVLDHGNAMYVQHLTGVRHVLTCHDLLAVRAALGLFPEWPIGRTGRHYQKLIANGIRLARNVVAVSEATRQDLVHLIHKSDSRIHLVYNCLYQDIHESDSSSNMTVNGINFGEKFFLHVGGNPPYKNRIGLLDIYSELLRILGPSCPKLVLAGSPPSDSIERRLREFSSNQVIVIKRPSSPVIAQLYRNAIALLFPSLAEGFGLPILEAQTMGCPVFTSQIAPMTEVGGRAARYFDPRNPVEAAMIIQKGLDQLDSMRLSGIENSRQFSTDRMIHGYLNIYRDAD